MLHSPTLLVSGPAACLLCGWSLGAGRLSPCPPNLHYWKPVPLTPILDTPWTAPGRDQPMKLADPMRGVSWP